MKIIAKLYLLRTDEGGRKTPWRPWGWAFDFGVTDEDGMHMLNDCWIDLGQRTEMAPGEELTVQLEPIIPDLVLTAVKPGLAFTVWDGRTVGQGTVIEVVD